MGRRSFRRVVVVAMVALGGCGASTPKIATTKATTTTKTVQAPNPVDALSALVAKTQSGVVRIEASTCDAQSIGTGFLIGPRLVATVEHVVDGATSITLKQGGRKVATGTVIGEDPARDVALVQASNVLKGTIVPLAIRAPRLGETVAALGFPLGLPLSVTQGSVSGLQRSVPINGLNRQDMVQTDAAINPGNSGGPLLALDSGDVVGLVDLGTSQANGIAFAVSAQVAEPLLLAWETAPQPVPTAACATSSTTTTQQASVPTPQPSLSAFTNGFAADKAQFRQLGRDLSTAISGAASQTDSDLAAEFGALASRATQQSAQLRQLNPPAQYQSQVDALAAGFDSIATDLQEIASAAAAHDAQAARSATTALVQDAASVQSDDKALTAALGLPATG